MPKQLRKLILGKDLYEYDKHETESLPCAVYFSDIQQYVNGEIPWHWHKEFELGFILQGTVAMMHPNGEIFLREGEGMFINTNVLHRFSSVLKEEGLMASIVFDYSLVSGVTGSVFEKRYLTPLMKSNEIKFLQLTKDNEWQKKILTHVKAAYESCNELEIGYEFVVKAELSHLLAILFRNIQHKLEEPETCKSKQEEYVKTMIEYINRNFSERILIEDIAASANISRRECYRCFQSYLGTTPAFYLEKYRMRNAIKLLADTNKSIAEVCYSTGFNNQSYFTKKFHNLMGYTPSEYKKTGVKI